MKLHEDTYNGKNVVVVSHSRFMRNGLQIDFHPPNGGVFQLVDNVWKLIDLN